MSIIKLENIYVKYNDKEVLSDFSLNVDKGDKVLITGKSGSGKSTIFKIILGFADIDKGELLVEDKTILDEDFKEIRNMFSYVNQDVSLRPGVVSEVLEEISKFSKNNYDASFNKELANYFEFDLKLLKKDTQELSGGERQRLGIILAIMLNRPVFLLDEVTSALDENLKDKVCSYFANTDKTVIVISHDNIWQNNNKFRKVVWNGNS